MATAVAEQILELVEFRMGLINPTDGYENTISQVLRTKRLDDDFTPLHNTIVIEWDDKQPNPAHDCPGNPPAKGWNLNVDIIGLMSPSEADTTAADTFRNQMAGDIVVALADVDSGQWRQWNGLALNTELGPIAPYHNSAGQDIGVRVSITIAFRTVEGDPFISRA